MSEFDYTQEERQRDVTRGLYQKFYIETPVEDAEFAAADEAANMIELSIQIVDPAGDAMEEQFQIGLFLCDDAAGSSPNDAPGGLSVTTGAEIQEIVAAQHLNCLTDDTGLLVVEITDAVGAASYYMGVFLPNGKYAVSPEIAFV